MNYEDLTLKQLREIATMFGGADSAPKSPHIGKACVIRTYASGVHFGTFAHQSGRQVELTNSRRCWRWDVKSNGISLSELANHGPTDSRSKICENLPTITLLDALEIIPCSEEAVGVFIDAPVAKS